MQQRTAIERMRTEFESRRARNSAFSLRSYARWLQVSPAQLSQVLSGKRRLSPKIAARFSDRIGLSPKDKLELLQSLSPEITDELSKVGSKGSQLQLAEDQFRLIADWHHFAILSLTRLAEATDDPRWVARRLGIGVPEANEAITRLRRLGVLSPSPEFTQIGDPISVSSSIPSRAIRTYHRQNLALAAERIEDTPIDKREFQSITMAISPGRIEKFREVIDQFLTEASNELESRTPREVYTLAVQLFPVTKNAPKRNSSKESLE